LYCWLWCTTLNESRNLYCCLWCTTLKAGICTAVFDARHCDITLASCVADNCPLAAVRRWQSTAGWFLTRHIAMNELTDAAIRHDENVADSLNRPVWAALHWVAGYRTKVHFEYELPGAVQIVTAGYPYLVPGKIPYASHLCLFDKE